MLPLQLVLRPERDECAWPSPPRTHAKKRRNSASSPTRRANPRLSRTPLVLCSSQQSYRSSTTKSISPRRRSRHITLHYDPWMAMRNLGILDIPRVCFHVCSTVIEAVISKTTIIAHSVLDTLQSWWSGGQVNDSTSLEIVERQSEDAAIKGVHDILEENSRLKRMLEFAMTSHVIMNEATTMLEDSADLWMKRAEDAVGAKVHEAEQERDSLAVQLGGLQEQLFDKDQEIERLRDGFGTDSLLIFG
ncbi:unnamed protein product [Phytophthora fragariaefolia]|uniref:Unnamed protein product n=1 Tax=Phytophthora fragariaefolia TaxID=1490495 RepID=A0A9W7D056_9STRA|nr:unnamed protein product [Phytophthora fragariaefolia]